VRSLRYFIASDTLGFGQHTSVYSTKAGKTVRRNAKTTATIAYHLSARTDSHIKQPRVIPWRPHRLTHYYHCCNCCCTCCCCTCCYAATATASIIKRRRSTLPRQTDSSRKRKSLALPAPLDRSTDLCSTAVPPLSCCHCGIKEAQAVA
jgi:hypothetical protein